MATQTVLFLATTLVLSAGQVPPKCCLSESFQATLTDLTTINGNSLELMDFAFDITQQKQAMVTYIFNPETRTSNITGRAIFDFVSMKEFFIPNDDPSQCTVNDLNFRVPRCVPDDAEYLGSTYLGPLSALPYDGWRYTLEDSDMVLTIAISTQGCVPILEGVSTPGQPEFDELLFFTNYEPTIHHPEIFIIPRSCNQ